MTPSEIHAKFKALPGSREIASEFACTHLAKWLERRRPKVVVELGSGIGTLSAVILEHVSPYASVWGIEPNAWCRQQWRQNLGKAGERVVLCGATVPTTHRVEFLVLDGGDQRSAYYQNLARRAVIVVEGGRRPQRAVLEAELRRNRRTFCLASWRPWDRSKGLSVYQLDPTRWERAWFLAVRLREWVLDLGPRLAHRPIGKKRAPLPAGQTP